MYSSQNLLLTLACLIVCQSCLVSTAPTGTNTSEERASLIARLANDVEQYKKDMELLSIINKFVNSDERSDSIVTSANAGASNTNFDELASMIQEKYFDRRSSKRHNGFGKRSISLQ